MFKDLPVSANLNFTEIALELHVHVLTATRNLFECFFEGSGNVYKLINWLSVRSAG
jgi:hypothetical protein